MVKGQVSLRSSYHHFQIMSLFTSIGLLLSAVVAGEVTSLNATEYSAFSVNASGYSGMDLGFYSSNGTRKLINTPKYTAVYSMNSTGYSLNLWTMYSSNETDSAAAFTTNASGYAREGHDFAMYLSNETRRLINTTEYAAAYPMNASGYSVLGRYEYSGNETRHLMNSTEYSAALPMNMTEYGAAYPMNDTYGYLRVRR